jgi:hypothetical protein
MSRIISFTCLLILLVTFAGACSEQIPSEHARMIDISKITGDELKALEKICDNEEMIIYAPAGYALDINLNVKGDVASSEVESSIKLKFAKPVYFFFTKDIKDPLFSIDGKTWKKATDLFKGSITFGVSETDKENKPYGNFTFEVNMKE